MHSGNPSCALLTVLTCMFTFANRNVELSYSFCVYHCKYHDSVMVFQDYPHNIILNIAHPLCNTAELLATQGSFSVFKIDRYV